MFEESCQIVLEALVTYPDRCGCNIKFSYRQVSTMASYLEKLDWNYQVDQLISVGIFVGFQISRFHKTSKIAHVKKGK